MGTDQESNITLSPRQLKRLKIFVEMTDEQVSTFLDLVELIQVKANQILVKMNESGDSMYFLLEGDVRVSQLIEEREIIIANLETGDFFGEMCLCDDVPRSADVVANRTCTLLKISRPAFDRIKEQHPTIAVLFLQGIIRSLGVRLRKVNKKNADSMLLARHWNGGAGRPLPSTQPAPRPFRSFLAAE
jgi:CRP-like cAMP-binding protein